MWLIQTPLIEYVRLFVKNPQSKTLAPILTDEALLYSSENTDQIEIVPSLDVHWITLESRGFN